MIILLHTLIIKWHKNKKRYNSDGLLVDDLPFYYNNLNKEAFITELPYIIGMSKEFNEMKINYDESEIKQLFEFLYHISQRSTNMRISLSKTHWLLLYYI